MNIKPFTKIYVAWPTFTTFFHAVISVNEFYPLSSSLGSMSGLIHGFDLIDTSHFKNVLN
jgi:hypothetical protein